MFYSCVVQLMQVALDSTVLRSKKSVAHGLSQMAERGVKDLNEVICGTCVMLLHLTFNVSANPLRASREVRQVEFR